VEGRGRFGKRLYQKKRKDVEFFDGKVSGWALAGSQLAGVLAIFISLLDSPLIQARNYAKRIHHC
jgi:hypothetical protein